MTETSDSIPEQARLLVARMTLQEKAGLCSGGSFWALKSVDRLGLPSITVTDGPHGLRKQRDDSDHLGLTNSVPATCFPSLTALGSSWDRALVRRVAAAIAAECIAENVAVLLGPGINMKRHPLSGRNFEYFSEDPLLTGILAAAFIEGVQSRGVGSCLKHFAAYNQETQRMIVDVVVDERTLREIYLRAFELAIELSAPWSVMSSYNRINGCYASDHRWLLGRVLRQEWGYRGMVISDWMGTNDRVRGVAAGLDREMPGSGGQNDACIVAAVENGRLAESDLDRAVTRVVELILKAQQRPAAEGPLDLEVHHRLSREAAARSAVLLKNRDDILPLRSGQHIAVIGAFARSPRFQGGGSSHVNAVRVDSAFDALRSWVDEPARAGTVLSYAVGYDPVHSAEDPQLIEAACAAAQQADVALVFVGLPESFDTEISDRDAMSLPAQHDRLIEAVAATDTPTVVVLHNGAPVTMGWVDRVTAPLKGSESCRTPSR
jgi:beta-glucosidase